jgi:hypothetical protein
MTRTTVPGWFAVAALTGAIGVGAAFAQSPSPDARPQGSGAPLAGPHVGPHAGPHGGSHAGSHAGSHGGRGERMMQRADADRDGRVSRAEFETAQQAAMARRMQAFDAADTDRDGSLSPAEIQAMREAHRARSSGPRGPGGPRGPAAPSGAATPGA